MGVVLAGDFAMRLERVRRAAVGGGLPAPVSVFGAEPGPALVLGTLAGVPASGTPAGAVAEYVEWGRLFRDWSDGHAGNVTRQLRFFVRVAPLNFWADFTFLAPRLEVVAGRAFKGMSVDTLSTDSNENLMIKVPTLQVYARGLLAWCRWLSNAKRKLISGDVVNELKAVEWPRSKGEKDDFRRPYSAEELRRLFWVCSPARKLLYWVAIETGYRLSELGRLTAANFDAAGRKLRLSADETKNAKKARGKLSEALCTQLAAIVPLLGPGAPLLEVPSKGARTIYSDLAVAKIDHADHGDGRLDFHSLRGSSAALRFELGATVPEVQRMMRHADPALTTHYAKSQERRDGEIVEMLPEMIGAEAREEEAMLWD